MWPKHDVEATCEFMEQSSKFFEILNVSFEDHQKSNTKDVSKLDQEKCRQLQEVAQYMRNVAMPCGVLVKSTAQGIIQTCNATLKLIKILVDKIGISPVCTARLQKRALWAQMVEHTLQKEKLK